MLELDGVRIAMGTAELHADWRVEQGTRVAVIGPSGAGKSTLLDAIAGFRPVTAGRVRLDGADVSLAPPQARPVSILFQDGNLFPHLGVGRNLGLALRPDGSRPRGADRARIDAALERVGLTGFFDRMPGTLSGGQASRAALARVLLQDRALLLLDEPFAALGPALRRDMLALVGEVADGMDATVLMVTHDPDEARSFAGVIVGVVDGVAVAPQPIGAFFDAPPAAMRDYLGR